MQGHVRSLGRLDKRIVAQLQIFRDIYRLSVDHLMMERTYRIEASVGQLVSERVRATGESEATLIVLWPYLFKSRRAAST